MIYPATHFAMTAEDYCNKATGRRKRKEQKIDAEESIAANPYVGGDTTGGAVVMEALHSLR